jgi:DNA-directed RNA polymerase I subunit RPA43
LTPEFPTDKKMADVEVAHVSSPAKDASRKHSKESKKRHRDPNSAEGIERKRKRTKSDGKSDVKSEVKSEVAVVSDKSLAKAINDGSTTEKKQRQRHKKSSTADEEPATKRETQPQKQSKKKSRKHKHPVTELEQATATPAESQPQKDPETVVDKPKTKESKRPRKNKAPRHSAVEDVATGHPDVMVIDSAPSKLPNVPTDHKFPFYTQTVSQYLPLHPFGISEPIHGYTDQHLKPLLNRYVTSFGGVLLAYRNPRIGEAPGRGSLKEDSTMDDMAVLESINEAAVSFGWLTVEIDIFRPTRGALLDGLVNLQGGGHIGLVCWGKFNASIESERLPRGWRWIDELGGSKKKDETNSETSLPSESHEDNAEEDHTEVHTTGYWVDNEGSRIKGDTPICFRIKNYEVGTSGEYGYLSIEGTMLSEEEEEKKVRGEIATLRRKLRHGAVLRRERRPLPESSMTKFGQDEAAEPESQLIEVVSRPRSETNV